jgi:hypothetical protein
MAKTSRKLRVDRDGVRVFETSGAKRFDARIAITVLALVAVGAGVFLLWPSSAPPQSPSRVAERAPDVTPAAAEVEQAAQAEVPVRSNRNVRAVQVGRSAAPNEAAELPDEKQKKDQPEIDARDVILALQASGEKEGIAAFNPPGTNPPMSGIIVPEGFDLPEGYVRHYQVTDDGERLDPILMFSPDYQFVDPSGKPTPLPKDLVVPRELAPPGLPIHILEVPKRRLH